MNGFKSGQSSVAWMDAPILPTSCLLDKLLSICLSGANFIDFPNKVGKTFNHLFSTVYFQRTDHGGRRHEGTTKSKLLLVGWSLRRRILWMTGVGDEIFNNTAEK
jgi:hypothetical protein